MLVSGHWIFTLCAVAKMSRRPDPALQTYAVFRWRQGHRVQRFVWTTLVYIHFTPLRWSFHGRQDALKAPC
jgi:hypothetical protein